LTSSQKATVSETLKFQTTTSIQTSNTQTVFNR